MKHIHCSICNAGATRLIGQRKEPLCDSHFDWLLENSIRLPVFVRIISCSCGASNKEKRATYRRSYRECNKEKRATYQRSYYERNKDKAAAYQRSYRERNKEKEAAYQRSYRERNKEKEAAYQRSYYERNHSKYEALA